MTATEELRRLLDERGVEWRDSSDENVLHTTWNGMNCWFNEFPDGWTAWGMAMRGTPEQAIAATLGPCSDSSNCTNGERTCERTDLAAENARLQEQMERLVTLLRNRACKAEAENARLRAMQDTWQENDARLRELVRHMHTCMEHYEPDGSVSCDRCPLDNDTGDCDYERRMRELGMGEDG